MAEGGLVHMAGECGKGDNLEATEQGVDNCPICLECLKSPRALVGCKHVFCALCLATFVYKHMCKVGLNAKGRRRRNNNLSKCPLCREPIRGITSRESITEWINSLPGIAGTTSDMGEAEDKTKRNSLCSDIGLDLERNGDKTGDATPINDCLYSSQAKHSDLTCNEQQCEKHANVHTLSEDRRQVKSVDTDSDVNQTTKLQEKSRLICPVHSDKVAELYCLTHASYMCILCLIQTKLHRDCDQIIETSVIEQVLGNSNVVHKLLFDVRSVMQLCEVSVATLRSAVQESNSEEDGLRAMFAAVRKQAMDLINGIEQEVITHAKGKIEKQNSVFESIIEDVSAIKQGAAQSESMLTDLMDSKSYSHTLIHLMEKVIGQNIQRIKHVDNIINKDISVSTFRLENPNVNDISRLHLKRERSRLELPKSPTLSTTMQDVNKLMVKLVTAAKSRNTCTSTAVQYPQKHEKPFDFSDTPSNITRQPTTVQDKKPSELIDKPSNITRQPTKVPGKKPSELSDKASNNTYLTAQLPNNNPSELRDKPSVKTRLTAQVPILKQNQSSEHTDTTSFRSNCEKRNDIGDGVFSLPLEHTRAPLSSDKKTIRMDSENQARSCNSTTESSRRGEQQSVDKSAAVATATEANHDNNSGISVYRDRFTAVNVKTAPPATKAIYIKGCFTALIETPDEREPWIADVLALSDKRVVVSDNQNSRLILLTEDLDYISELSLSFIPGRMAVIGDQCLLVCLMNIKRIAVVSVGDEIAIGRYFTTNHHPKCILPVDNNTIVVSMLDGLQNWQLLEMRSSRGHDFRTSRQIMRTLEGLRDGYALTISSDLNQPSDYRILQCCEADDVVYCFNSSGRTLFKLDVEQPKRALCDKDNNIMVVTFSGKIHVFDKDGTSAFNTSNQVLRAVYCAALDHDSDKMYVGRYKKPTISVVDVLRHPNKK